MTNAKWPWLFFMLLGMHIPLLSQTGMRLNGVVVDSVSSLPMPGVHVRVERSAPRRDIGMVVTDMQGRFSVVLSGEERVHLVFGHLGYEVKRIDAARMVADDTLRIALSRKAYEIPEVLIGRRAPEVVYQRRDLHVGDHYATREGIWVLAYEQPRLWHREENSGEQLLRNARLVLLDTMFQERAARVLPGEVRRLHRDHRGRVVVDGRTEAWVAEWRDSLIVMGMVDRTTLHTSILPWTDSTSGRLLGTNRTNEWPVFDHLSYDRVTDEQLAFCTIQDEHVLALFRSQYKYMSGRDKVIAMDMEIATGVDREVVAGYMTGFQHDPYFKVPYAPLFVVDDTLCVFDHVRQRIRRFTPEGEGIDEVPMIHTNDRRWRGRLLQDMDDGGVYALFARGANSWLCRVDPATGALGTPASLTHPFPEEVQIHAGHAYYVYRPQGARDHRTLYREALR